MGRATRHENGTRADCKGCRKTSFGCQEEEQSQVQKNEINSNRTRECMVEYTKAPLLFAKAVNVPPKYTGVYMGSKSM